MQLTIEDGGPSDTDGIANHVIEDLGQIGVVEVIEPLPAPVATGTNNEPQAENNAGGGGIINLAVILGLSLFAFWVQLRVARRRYAGW